MSNVVSEPTDVSQYTVTTDKGDVFYVTQMRRTMNFEVKLYVETGQKRTFMTYLFFHPEDYQRLRFTLLNDSSKYRMYDVSDKLVLIKLQDSKRYDYIPYEFLDTWYLKTSHRAWDHFLYQTAQKMVATKDWHWFDTFAGFLVLNHDKTTIRMVQRYAKGNFTKEELAINDNDTFARDQIIGASAALVDKFDL